MNKLNISIDNSVVVAELLEIKSILWAFAQTRLAEGKEWEDFVSTVGRCGKKFLLEFLYTNRKSIPDSEESIQKILKDNPQLKHPSEG